MADELHYQRQLNKRVVAMGGYARKWSTRFTVGVPDLIWVLDGRTAFVEVKLEHVTSLKFDRKLEITPKQALELAALRRAGANVAVAIVVKRENSRDAFLVIKQPPEPREVLRITGADLDNASPWVAPLNDCDALLRRLLTR